MDIPQDFLVNHISGSFVEMVLWWIKGRMKQTPEELDRYFRAVIEPDPVRRHQMARVPRGFTSDFRHAKM